ncbi:HK97 gp10 family phage protein [Petroclostridium xylanilyticum]|jgi:hypothetical protein|uniref:HK97 gp10 family phage protein n=1 Tax=Petroclostridium xylanilyticum TaxID=1792311 RepID=UPI000B9859F2|nr:HK97 gp10 family phage protein [Petroclostridium xylanilyticum]
MNTNQRANEIRLKQFREELELMLEDVKEIDKKMLTKAVNVGLVEVKKNTPTGNYPTHVEFIAYKGTEKEKLVSFDVSKKVGGHLKKSWHVSRTEKTNEGVEKKLYNTADYALYVNNGHRIVRHGKTVGFVKGKFMLEKAMGKVDKAIVDEFKKEVEEVKRKHGK